MGFRHYFVLQIWNHPDVLYDYLTNSKDIDIDLDLPELQQQAKQRKTARQHQQQQHQQSPQPPLFQRQLSLSSDISCNDNESDTQSSYSEKLLKPCDYSWAIKLMEGYKTGIIENGAKLKIAFSLIEESVLIGDKILLFSQSLLTLNLIEQYLNRLNVPNTCSKWEKNKNYFRIDGSTSGLEREKLINVFNKKDNGVWLFLLSTRYGLKALFTIYKLICYCVFKGWLFGY